jgi:outer membrane protein assembly factor BamE (lipoprotein component of BamABCDE complex)
MLGMMNSSFLVMAAAMLAVAGCSSPAKRLEPAVINQFREGAATRQEVERKLGKPSNVMTGSNRKTVAVYEYGRIMPTPEPRSTSVLPTPIGTVQWRTFSILYNDRDVVEKTLFHESVTPYERNMSSVSAGHVVGEAELSVIKVGETKAADLRQVFGPPMGKTMTVDGDIVLAWFYGKAAGRFEPSLKRQTLLVRVNDAEVVVDYVVAGNISPQPVAK